MIIYSLFVFGFTLPKMEARSYKMGYIDQA